MIVKKVQVCMHVLNLVQNDVHFPKVLYTIETTFNPRAECILNFNSYDIILYKLQINVVKKASKLEYTSPPDL